MVCNATDENRPNFVATNYGYGEALAPRTNIPKARTPMFIAVAIDDELVPVQHSLNVFNKWLNAGQPAKAHIYQKEIMVMLATRHRIFRWWVAWSFCGNGFKCCILIQKMSFESLWSNALKWALNNYSDWNLNKKLWKVQFILLALAILISSSNLFSQQVIRLYPPGKAPGSENWNWERKNPAGGFPLVYNVTNPTLIAFKPEVKNATGKPL